MNKANVSNVEINSIFLYLVFFLNMETPPKKNQFNNTNLQQTSKQLFAINVSFLSTFNNCIFILTIYYQFYRTKLQDTKMQISIRLLFTVNLLLFLTTTSHGESIHGKITNGEYNNAYFNFSIKLPKKWFIKFNQKQNGFNNKKSTYIEKNKKLQEEFSKSSKRTHTLISATKFSPFALTYHNPTFSLIAENIKKNEAIRYGKDYLFRIKQIFKHTKSKYKLVFKGEGIEKINSFLFDTMEFELELTKVKVKQKMFATIYKNYVLFIFYTYVSKKDKIIMSKIMQSLKKLK